MIVHLVRHGEVRNPARVRYGRMPGFGLSDRGRAQAKATGHRLAARGVAEIVSSPLERAVQTAEIIARACDVDVVTRDERLIESETVFDRLPLLAPAYPWHWHRLWNPLRPSWGEPFDAIAARMLAVVRELAARHPHGEAVAVSHRTPIWTARHRLSRWGPPWLSRPRTTHASVTSLHLDGGACVSYGYWEPVKY